MNIYIGLKLLTRYVIFFSMRTKSVWEKLKTMFGETNDLGGSKESRDWVRRQFLDITRLGGNPIVMKMGN